MDIRTRARRLLWLDSLAALTVGLVVLTFLDGFVALHGLPRGVVLASGLANLAYGTYSGTIASVASRRDRPPRAGVVLLIAANAAWSLVCVTLLLRYGAGATLLGWLHVAGEGLFVAWLAALEWRWVLPVTR